MIEAAGGVKIKTDGSVAYVLFDRPKALNAMTLETLRYLKQKLSDCEGQDSIKAIVLTSENGNFSSGADIIAFKKALIDGTATDLMHEMVTEANHIVLMIRKIGKPIIAVVDGFAFGIAFDLLLSCDYVYATEMAQFQVGFHRFGLIPDGGGTFLLPIRLGMQKANEIIFSEKPLSAREATNLGIVNATYKDKDAMDSALARLLKNITNGPKEAFRKTKYLINEAMLVSFAAHLDKEREIQVERVASCDFTIGLNALLSKTKPNFDQQKVDEG